jgi:hypothetical protein
MVERASNVRGGTVRLSSAVDELWEQSVVERVERRARDVNDRDTQRASFLRSSALLRR